MEFGDAKIWTGFIGPAARNFDKAFLAVRRAGATGGVAQKMPRAISDHEDPILATRLSAVLLPENAERARSSSGMDYSRDAVLPEKEFTFRCRS
jgi:hypothetical protein